MKASFWEKQGVKKAMKRFQEVASRVPAYKKLLEEHKINPSDVTTIEAYKKLPILDKKNYLNKFGIEELCLDGKLSGKYLIDRSSGFSGTSFFWPRLAMEDVDYPAYMKLAYEQFYRIHEKSTLMIITLALGTWVGGEKISWATREIALRGNNPFTVITPGLDLEETLAIVDYFKSKFDQIVLVGYPPFIKTIIDQGQKRGIDWKSLNIKIGLGGEGYSENWREYIRDNIGLSKNDLMGIAGGYGAADVGMSVGREYPITVQIRKLANINRELAVELFGAGGIPSLCQYNPATYFIEGINGELVFSVLTGTPLIRYNIHDRGGTIPFESALAICRKHGYEVIDMLIEKGYSSKDIWRLPLFYVNGRTDGTVIIDGTNVYPDNVESAFYGPDGHKINSFKLEIRQDANFNESLWINLELKRGIELPKSSETDSLNKTLQNSILQALLSSNHDYCDAYRRNAAICKPCVAIHQFGEGPFKNDGSKIKIDYIYKN
jgi:phenylacetate-CoA ligase